MNYLTKSLINNKKFTSVKTNIIPFRKFEAINEAESAESTPLRGYPYDTIIDRISELMNIMPDRVKFGVPSDNKGHSMTYRDANGSIQKIKDIHHFYSAKGEDVKFYCWNISYAGSWDATQSLKSKVQDNGGFGNESNLNLKKVIDYFSKNAEDVDNVRSISISIDSVSIRKATSKNLDDDTYPQQDASSRPGTKESEESEESKE